MFPTSSWILYRSNPLACSALLLLFLMMDYFLLLLAIRQTLSSMAFAIFFRPNSTILPSAHMFVRKKEKEKKDFPTHLIKKERRPQCTHVSEKKKLPHTLNLRREGNSGLAKTAQLPLDLKCAHLQFNETPSCG